MRGIYDFLRLASRLANPFGHPSRDRVTLGGEPTFSHVNGFKRVNSPSRAKSLRGVTHHNPAHVFFI